MSVSISNINVIIIESLLLCMMILTFIGMLGLLINRKHALYALICLELMALGIALSYLHVSLRIIDNIGIVMALIVVIASGVESAIGLALLLGYFRAAGSISLIQKKRLKG